MQLEIRGLGESPNDVVIDAESRRMFFVEDCADIRLYSLTLSNGNTGSAGNGNGGLIYVTTGK